LQYLSIRRPLRTILITSASPEQGKTTVTANLAVAIAQSGASTIAVEGDLRRPRLDNAFSVSQSGVGLTSVLVGAAELDDATMEIPLAGGGGPSGRGAIAFLPSGPQPPNPSELLSSAQMTSLLDRLSVTYDFVLIDSPPVLLVADALELARIVDGVVLVVRANHSTTDEARELRAVVERLGIHLLGVVMTDVPSLGSYAYGAIYGQRPSEAAPASAAGGSERLEQPQPATAVAAAEPETWLADDGAPGEGSQARSPARPEPLSSDDF
jgi:capsular exopolysaccharide synthesis family protein